MKQESRIGWKDMLFVIQRLSNFFRNKWASQCFVLFVAAASDMRFAMDDLVREFNSSHPQEKVQVSYGSSGSLVAQLVQGAPFDVFFSADTQSIQNLDSKGLLVEDSILHYATGSLVLWTSDPHVDLETTGMQSLLVPAVKKIAIANPSHAPYGKAALAALHSVGIYDQIKGRLVFAESVTQTAQLVQDHLAQVGFIALSLAKAPAMNQRGKYWKIPLRLYPELDQVAAILKSTKNLSMAKAFLNEIGNPQGKKILSNYGFRFSKE